MRSAFAGTALLIAVSWRIKTMSSYEEAAEHPVAADEALFVKLRHLARCSSLREAASHGPTLASPLNQTLSRFDAL